MAKGIMEQEYIRKGPQRFIKLRRTPDQSFSKILWGLVHLLLVKKSFRAFKTSSVLQAFIEFGSRPVVN